MSEHVQDREAVERALNVAAQRFYEASSLTLAMTDKPKVVEGLRAALSAVGWDEMRAYVERLRGAATGIERLADTYTTEGTDIVLGRIIDLRRERDRLRAGIEGLRASLDVLAARVRRGPHMTDEEGRLLVPMAEVFEALAVVRPTVADGPTEGGERRG